MFVAEAPVYLKVDVEAVKLPAGDDNMANGVPEPESLQMRLPAFKVVAPAWSPLLPTDKMEATVTVPVPPVCVVMVMPVVVELLKVRLLKVQSLAPEVVPKFFAAPTLCSNAPPVKLIVPAPVTLPLAVMVSEPEPDKAALAFTVKSPAMFKTGELVVVVTVTALVPSPIVKLLPTVVVAAAKV